jgi:exopolysaccharide production protein ExoZ
MVVFHHYNQVFFNWDMSNSIIGAEVGDFFRFYGKLGVDIFFVISGFIMYFSLNKRPTTSRDFLINRIVRVIPVYWFYTILLLILTLFSVVDMESQFTASSLFKSLLFIPHDNPSEKLGLYPFLTVGWTLNFEMFFYVTLALMLAVLKNKAVLGTFVLLLGLPVFWSELNLGAWGFSSVLTSSYLYEFAIGLGLGFIYCKENSYIKNNNFLSLILICTGLFFMTIYGQGGSEYKYISVALVVAGTLCLKDSLFDNKLGQFLCYLGNISYSTYLVHTIILYMLVHYFGTTVTSEPLQESLILGIYLSAIFISSKFSYEILETGRLNNQFRIILSFLFLNKSANSSSRSC